MLFASIALLALVPALLTPGAPVRRTIAGPAKDVLRIAPAAGELVSGSIDQDETDFVVDVLAPNDRVIATFDSRERGTDLFTFLAVEDGGYRISVRKVVADGRAATYTVRLEPYRAPTPDDERLIEAERRSTNA